jgi:hypothetical protein
MKKKERSSRGLGATANLIRKLFPRGLCTAHETKYSSTTMHSPPHRQRSSIPAQSGHGKTRVVLMSKQSEM